MFRFSGVGASVYATCIHACTCTCTCTCMSTCMLCFMQFWPVVHSRFVSVDDVSVPMDNGRESRVC